MPIAFVEPGQRLQVTSSSTWTAVLEPGLISRIQDIKVLEPVFEELAVSSQTRNSRFEGGGRHKTCVCNSVFWGFWCDLLFQPVCWGSWVESFCCCADTVTAGATRYRAWWKIEFLVATVWSRVCFHWDGGSWPRQRWALFFFLLMKAF